MHKLILPIILLLSSYNLYAAPTEAAKALIKQQQAQANHITPEQLAEALKTSKKITLIDVRQTSERPILGKITENDLHIARGYIEIVTYSKITNRDTPIVVFCGKGIRSAFAANTLTKMGYTNVRNLKGGVMGWKNAGFETLEMLDQ